MELGLVDVDPDEQGYGGEEKARVPCVAAFWSVTQKEGELGMLAVTVNHVNDVVPVSETSSFSMTMLEPCRRTTFETVSEGPPAADEMGADRVE